MILVENQKSIGEKAGNHFKNGFNCAEAVAAAVLEGIGEDATGALAHATAFGGGFGRTFEEACGALSGGIIAIGQLFGRHSPEENWDIPAELAARMRESFLEQYKTSHCATLRERFGEEKQAIECYNIVKVVAAELAELLSCPKQQ